MNMKILKELLNSIRLLKKKIFRTDVNKYNYKNQKKLLDKYKDKDIYLRKYYINADYYGKTREFILNTLSAIGLLPFLLFLLLKPKKTDKVNSSDIFINNTSVFDILPNELQNNVKNIIREKKYFLTYHDFVWIVKNLFKYINKPLFVIDAIQKISNYSYHIKKYNPKIIVCSLEYSFSSNIVTKYCNDRNIKHINIMHGERYFLVKDSYSYFNEYYVWDDYYVKLHKELRMCTEKYHISLPQNFINDINKKDNSPKVFKYYLSLFQVSDLKQITNNLKKIRDKFGYKVVLRYHPGSKDAKYLEELKKDFIIESPFDINIFDSIDESDYICSIFSSVLYQGYLRKAKIVIDNISNKKKYCLGKNLKGIIFSKKHELLSNLIK